MSLPIDYIFKKPLDKCFVIIVNILTSSEISIEFMKRNTILALDDLCYHRPLYGLPSNTKLFVFCVIPWVPCYPAIVLLYIGVLPSFMSRMSWEFHHLLRNSWYSDASHHHSSPLGPRVEWTLLWEFNISSNLVTSELMDNNSNVVCRLLNFHSDVVRATQPIFRVHLSTNV